MFYKTIIYLFVLTLRYSDRRLSLMENKVYIFPYLECLEVVEFCCQINLVCAFIEGTWEFHQSDIRTCEFKIQHNSTKEIINLVALEISEIYCPQISLPNQVSVIIMFIPHVPMSSNYNFTDNELKFCILS